jgi:hypothetical protein
MVRQCGGRNRALGTRRPIETPAAANRRWSLDLTNLSSKIIANWVLASHHSRGGIFHARHGARRDRAI